MPNAPTPTLRQVAWMNVWNWTHSGGHGSRVHLTSDSGLAGTTLCGKPYPRTKGCPIMVYVCKRCLKKAGMNVADTRDLQYVPSSPD